MDDLGAARQNAFNRLAELTTRLVDRGRSTRSAGVKPALQGLAADFDERRLGFRSFRAFLEAAEANGHITLRPVPGTPDVDVLPAGSLPVDLARGVGRPERIRPDLWSAFVDWRSHWERVYDRETHRVGWLPTVPSPDEAAPVARLRTAASDEPSRYVRIEPIQQDETLGWMTEFVRRLPYGTDRQMLEDALTNARPIRAFVIAVKRSGVKDAWGKERLEHVRTHIASWAEANDLELDFVTEREPLTAPPELRISHATRRPVADARHRPATSGPVSVDDLRDRVCRAVQAMSRAELLRLAIPLEYIVDEVDR